MSNRVAVEPIATYSRHVVAVIREEDGDRVAGLWIRVQVRKEGRRVVVHRVEDLEATLMTYGRVVDDGS